MKTISWIADYDFLARLAGGAEMSDREAYLHGLKQGYNMELVIPENSNQFSSQLTDLIVVSNASRFNINELAAVLNTKPYVMYLHDYWPLCKYRLFYPMKKQCKTCNNVDVVKKLLLNSKLNIFLSELHMKAWSFAIPEIKDHPFHIHPSPVNLNLFSPMPEVERKPDAGLIVSPMKFKGIENTLKWCEEHPDITFTIAGGQPQVSKLPKNCAYIGGVPTLKMPTLYAQASYYVELPDTPQPFNRTVLEAKLMGVPHLIVNKNIGALSYEWFEKDYATIAKHIKEAVPQWWEKIEQHAL